MILTPLLLVVMLLPQAGQPPESLIEGETGNAIGWLEFEDAIARVEADHAAGRASKMVFIEIYATWCPYCRRLDATTMQNSAVVEILNSRFYPVRMDGEYPEDITFRGQRFEFVPNGEAGYHELAVGLAGGKLSYPTLVFMNQNLEVVQPFAGYREASELLPILAFFGEGHYETTPWETFLRAYENRSE